jgi:hypothetical protein
MASRSLDPTSTICKERRTLGERYLEAVRNLTKLLEAQAQAVVNGEEGLERFELALNVAREQRRQTIHAFSSHVRKHGC